MLKKTDYIIIFVTCLFLGIFIIFQYSSVKEYKRVLEPENNATLAFEVAKLTKSNSDLRQEVKKLTSDLDTYQNSTMSSLKLKEQYQRDLLGLDLVNGELGKTGQGVTLTISGKLVTAQVVDLVNAIKNIGSGIISINGTRLTSSTDLARFAEQNSYEVRVLGNSKLLKSAIERKGGIVEQISNKDLKVAVSEAPSIEISKGVVPNLQYSKIIIDK